MIFKNNVFFQGVCQGLYWYVITHTKTQFFRALGVPGALQERQISFCCAWGGPLGAAKACSIANFEGNTCHFLIILLFVSSGFGDPPGGVEISCLGQRTAQGPLPKNWTAIWEPQKGGRHPKWAPWDSSKFTKRYACAGFSVFSRISGLFLFRGKLHQTLRLCRFQRFVNQRASSPGKPRGLSIRLSKD